MKMKQKLVASAVALSAFAGLAVPAAHAEVAATVGASNMYYWRGLDLGGGAALIGDVNISGNGFVAGIWTSSGDSLVDGLGGTEFDLYAGYSGKAGDFTYGVSVVNYIYPNAAEGFEPVSPGDYVEVIPTIGYGPLKVTYYDAVVAETAPLADKDYYYVTAELNFEKFAFKYGVHEFDLSHLDATYKFNEKLSFTLGKVIDDVDGGFPDEVNFVVNLSLPIM